VAIVIYSDADNTLWDTDALFVEAQLLLLQAAEGIAGVPARTSARLEFVRDYDQAIAVRHHSGLKYPPRLLIRALQEGIGGVRPEVAASKVLAEGVIPSEGEMAALETYAEVLSGMPRLLPGVRRGLEVAHQSAIPVHVISEGSLEVLQDRLQCLRLASLVASTLCATKSRDLYSRLKRRAAPHDVVMIGDQPDRDIQFAHEAELLTILVKGNFQPFWTESQKAPPADAVVADYLAAINWVVEKCPG
jgi:putative hydrolase of the HAD superfamily